MNTDGSRQDRPWGVLHHVHLYCTDLESAIQFWQQGFDAELLRLRKFGSCEGAELDIGSNVILYLKELDCVIPDSVDEAGFDHIGLMVENLERSLMRVLSLPGVSLKTPPFKSEGNLLCAFVHTAEGVVIELVQKETTP